MWNRIIFLKPHLVNKVWGGDRLSFFGINTKSKKIGEAWIVSGIPKQASIVTNQELKQIPLNIFYQKYPHFFNNYTSKTYPLLVKLLDCHQDLSIQVHPTKTYSKNHHNAQEKNEAWYIVNAKKNAEIIYGHYAKNKKMFSTLVEKQQWSKLLRSIKVKKNNIYFLPSGTLHALKSGLVIYEVQQPSDTTYRLFDYGREKYDKTRKLHVKEAIANVTIPFKKPIMKKNKKALLITPYFSMAILHHSGKKIYQYAHAHWLQCFVKNGSGYINDKNIKKGSVFLIGHNEKFSLKGKLDLILSYIQK